MMMKMLNIIALCLVILHTVACHVIREERQEYGILQKDDYYDSDINNIAPKPFTFRLEQYGSYVPIDDGQGLPLPASDDDHVTSARSRSRRQVIGTGCTATVGSRWATVPGIDVWCESNCNEGFCPPEYCTCSVTMPIPTTTSTAAPPGGENGNKPDH